MACLVTKSTYTGGDDFKAADRIVQLAGDQQTLIAIGQAEHARAPIGASFQPAGGAIVRAISQCESRGRFSAALHMVGGAFSPVGREIRVGMQKEKEV